MIPQVAIEPVYSELRDEEDFRPLLEDFAQAAVERRAQLADWFAAGQFEDIRVTAHQLKGSGAGVVDPGGLCGNGLQIDDAHAGRH